MSAPAPSRPTLALAMLTEGPAHRVGAVVEALRGILDEVVLLIDDRAPSEEQAALARMADVSRPVAFTSLEAHLQELHGLASCDWVLRLHSDELPSAALLRRLPSLVGDTRFRQWAIRRSWVFPDAGSWVDEVPWAPDFQLRLLHRDGQAFRDLRRSGVGEVAPVGYVDEAIWNLDCLVSSQEERQAKALVHDVMRPDVELAGRQPMHVLYEPERFATLPWAPVPPADAEALRALTRRRAT